MKNGSKRFVEPSEYLNRIYAIQRSSNVLSIASSMLVCHSASFACLSKGNITGAIICGALTLVCFGALSFVLRPIK